MKGFQITFFTRMDKKHKQTPLSEWLLHTAKQIGVHAATVFAASEGYGRDGRIHSAPNFFELGDQPQEILITATNESAERLFALLREEKINIAYIKTAVEFGVVGEDA